MILREREVIERAIEDGLGYALMRSYKYDDAPRSLEDWNINDRKGSMLDLIMASLDQVVAEWGGEQVKDL